MFKSGDFIKIRNTIGIKESNYVYIINIDLAGLNYFIEGEILFSSNPEKELTYIKSYTKPGDIIYKADYNDFNDENIIITQEMFELRRKLILLKYS